MCSTNQLTSLAIYALRADELNMFLVDNTNFIEI